MTDVIINFAYKSRDEFRSCTIEIEQLLAEATFRMPAYPAKM